MGQDEAWRSDDGAHWHQGSIGNLVEYPFNPELIQGAPYPVGVVRMGDEWLALSTLYGAGDAVSPVVFISKDGLTWTHLISSASWGFNATGLASNGTVVIATNIDYLGGSVFTSTDGVMWAEHVAPGGPAGLTDVYADPGAIVAVGWRDKNERSVPVVWLSKEGSAWTESNPIAAEGATTPKAVQRTPTGSFVMVATVVTAPAGCTTGACVVWSLGAWYSADGQTWQETELPVGAPLPAGMDYREVDLLPISGGVLAVASSADGWAAWATAEGTVWKAVDVPDRGLAISAGASNGASVLLFGTGAVLTGAAD